MTTAKKLPADDSEFDPASLEIASENGPEESLAPELSAATENLETWDDPPLSSGSEIPKVLPEDEIPPVEQLTAEGLEKADRDQRIAAADPDFEP